MLSFEQANWRRGVNMASLSIRKLNDDVYNQLQLLAVAHGVSMEEEVRCIISQAVILPQKLSQIFGEHFGSRNGVELVLPKREVHDALDFEQ